METSEVAFPRHLRQRRSRPDAQGRLARRRAADLGLGFYRGWFQIASDSADGESNLTLTVDKNKIEADRKKAQGTVHDLGHPVKD